MNGTTIVNDTFAQHDDSFGGAQHSHSDGNLDPEQQQQQQQLSSTQSITTNFHSLPDSAEELKAAKKQQQEQSSSSDNWKRTLNTAAGVAGNVLEWYDFAVFGYFSDILAEIFFPPQVCMYSTIYVQLHVHVLYKHQAFAFHYTQ
jgi:hypothetical protein